MATTSPTTRALISISLGTPSLRARYTVFVGGLYMSNFNVAVSIRLVSLIDEKIIELTEPFLTVEKRLTTLVQMPQDT